jgi:hypothetical protein
MVAAFLEFTKRVDELFFVAGGFLFDLSPSYSSEPKNFPASGGVFTIRSDSSLFWLEGKIRSWFPR